MSHPELPPRRRTRSGSRAEVARSAGNFASGANVVRSDSRGGGVTSPHIKAMARRRAMVNLYSTEDDEPYVAPVTTARPGSENARASRPEEVPNRDPGSDTLDDGDGNGDDTHRRRRRAAASPRVSDSAFAPVVVSPRNARARVRSAPPRGPPPRDAASSPRPRTPRKTPRATTTRTTTATLAVRGRSPAIQRSRRSRRTRQTTMTATTTTAATTATAATRRRRRRRPSPPPERDAEFASRSGRVRARRRESSRIAAGTTPIRGRRWLGWIRHSSSRRGCRRECRGGCRGDRRGRGGGGRVRRRASRRAKIGGPRRVEPRDGVAPRIVAVFGNEPSRTRSVARCASVGIRGPRAGISVGAKRRRFASLVDVRLARREISRRGARGRRRDEIARACVVVASAPARAEGWSLAFLRAVIPRRDDPGEGQAPPRSSSRAVGRSSRAATVEESAR